MTQASTDKLFDSGMSADKIEALKQLYSLWLESGEKAYSELAFTEEYSRNFADMVNLFMTFRQQFDAGIADFNREMTPAIPAGVGIQSNYTSPLPHGFATLADLSKINVSVSASEVVYQQDKVKLYRYKPLTTERHPVPVLIVYALVNRPYIMDLQDGRSLIQGLLKAGLDVYLLDWGYPDKEDVNLTLDDYINRYLDNSVDFIRQQEGLDRINMLGVCQGGTFSLCYTATHQQKIANLVTSVTPVDFHTRSDLLSHLVRHVDVDQGVDTLGNIPGEFLNWIFMLLRPYRLTGQKYLDALDFLDDKDKMEMFMRMEKWISDSPDQAGEAYRQFVKDFYQQNKLVKGEVQIGGKTIDLEEITIPIFNIYASNDHLVPSDSSKALAGCISSEDYTELELPGGHIGIYVGTDSQSTLPVAINEWLRQR